MLLSAGANPNVKLGPNELLFNVVCKNATSDVHPATFQIPKFLRKGEIITRLLLFPLAVD